MTQDTFADAGPVLRVDEAALKALPDPRGALRTIADRIIAALRAPPHFVRLTGLSPTEDRSLATALARTIAGTAPTPAGLSHERLMKVSFTQVRIDPEKAGAAGAVTAYSRTNQPLALHSDSSYLPQPHPLVLFQFVRADPAGGTSVMASVEAVLATLDTATIQTLATPQFPFGKGPQPILFGRRDAPHIRYYRSQIDTAAADAPPLPDAARAALDRLDAALAGEVRTQEFRAASGDITFMHNTKVLHGRRGFDAGSDRLMYRIRMHCGCLG